MPSCGNTRGSEEDGPDRREDGQLERPVERHAGQQVARGHGDAGKGQRRPCQQRDDDALHEVDPGEKAGQRTCPQAMDDLRGMRVAIAVCSRLN